MGDRSKIEWTDATWNPLRARNPAGGKVGHHCVKISPACTHCYAARQNKWTGTGLDYSASSPADTFLDEQALTLPLRWKRPRKIFVCSMTDLFGEWVSDEQIDRMFAVMALAQRHVFQVLTKRPERMHDYFAGLARRVLAWDAGEGETEEFLITHLGDAMDGLVVERCCDWLSTYNARHLGWPLPNVWIGTTIEDHQRCMERLDPLLQTPAAVRFVSMEPLLEPTDLALRNWAHIGQRRDDCRIDWVIVGGESGAGARPMHPDWVRPIRDDCQAAGVPFFFKQWGEWAPSENVSTGDARSSQHHFFHDAKGFPSNAHMYRVGKKAAGRLLDGREWNEFPAVNQEAAR